MTYTMHSTQQRHNRTTDVTDVVTGKVFITIHRQSLVLLFITQNTKEHVTDVVKDQVRHPLATTSSLDDCPADCSLYRHEWRAVGQERPRHIKQISKGHFWCFYPVRMYLATEFVGCGWPRAPRSDGDEIHCAELADALKSRAKSKIKKIKINEVHSAELADALKSRANAEIKKKMKSPHLQS
jgi:hypothetical protein